MIYPSRATYQNVPDAMKHWTINRWVNFMCIPEPNGKVSTKIPLTHIGGAASISNPRTWSNFNDCVLAMECCIGNAVGFALGSEFKLMVIDLDHCIDTNGALSPTAEKYIERLKPAEPYIERSISGNGIHLFVWYTGPDDHANNPIPGVEIYSTDRFIVMTGVPL